MSKCAFLFTLFFTFTYALGIATTTSYWCLHILTRVLNSLDLLSHHTGIISQNVYSMEVEKIQPYNFIWKPWKSKR